VLEGGIKEQPKLYLNKQDAFNRFTEQESNMGNRTLSFFSKSV
jgi:hypothetical protein